MKTVVQVKYVLPCYIIMSQ